MLPPQRIRPILRPAYLAGSEIRAARPVAPAPSATTFSTFANKPIARSIAASSTRTSSCAWARMIGKVFLPIPFTAMPSAMVGPPRARLASCLIAA